MPSRTENAGASGLALQMLGPLVLQAGGRPLAVASRKSLALCAFLARRHAMAAPRETLAGLFWADRDEEQARASLRQALSGLRKTLRESGQDVLQSDLSMIGLSAGAVRSDAAEFERLSAASDLPSLQLAADLYKADFLEGFPPISAEFDRWLDVERAALRSRFTTLLLRICDGHAAAGQTEPMIAAAQRLLSLDPLQEHVHRRLMQAYLLQKRHDAALRQFETLRALLADDLGVAPDQATLDLLREVRRQRAAAPGAAASVVERSLPSTETRMPPGRPSVAVLAFRNLSRDADTDLLGEGIAEDIIVELAREASLLVVSRGSSFRFSLEEQAVTQIGHHLGVRFLLGGSIRVYGSRLRLTAHLLECATGREIWAERYDRDLDNILDLQTEVARTVTATVVGRIGRTEAEAAGSRPLESLEAYALVLRGLGHVHAQTQHDLSLAIDCFERAVAIDPLHGRAFGLLALSRIYREWNYRMSTDVADILPIAERAIALDARDPKGHCALGLGHMLLRDYDRAGYHYEAGLRANPNDDLLLIEHGRYLMYADRPEDGLKRIREAMRIDPFHPNWYWNIQGRCLHTLGRHEEALAAFLRHNTPPFYVLAYIAACHRQLGNPRAAEEARAEMRRLRPDFDIDRFKSVFPYRNEETRNRFFESLDL